LYRISDGSLSREGRVLPDYVQREFEDYLKCGRLEHGFLRVRCETCHEERLVAFSCKRRGFCPSCGARRMAESSALLVDEVLPHEPIRAFSVGKSSSDHRSGAGYRLPRHLHTPGQEGRLPEQTYLRRLLQGLITTSQRRLWALCRLSSMKSERLLS